MQILPAPRLELFSRRRSAIFFRVASMVTSVRGPESFSSTPGSCTALLVITVCPKIAATMSRSLFSRHY
jgi:hypothetical protein